MSDLNSQDYTNALRELKHQFQFPPSKKTKIVWNQAIRRYYPDGDSLIEAYGMLGNADHSHDFIKKAFFCLKQERNRRIDELTRRFR